MTIQSSYFRKLLCAVDFSSISDQALRSAGLWARSFGSHIEVFHAHGLDYPRYFTESTMERLTSEREQELEAVGVSLRKKAETILGSEVDWKIQVSEGHAIEAIRKRVDEQSPDLVVLGSHGRSGIARLLLGSVTENVLHDIRRPALVVRGDEGGPHETVKRIICPVDFTTLSEECVEVAGAVAGKFGAHLRILHVSEGEAASSEAQERLSAWVKENVRSHSEVSSVVRTGNAAEQIVQTARKEHTDLIVIAVRHRPFLEYSTIGTTTERVLRHSPCPVLTVQ